MCFLYDAINDKCTAFTRYPLLLSINSTSYLFDMTPLYYFVVVNPDELNSARAEL